MYVYVYQLHDKRQHSLSRALTFFFHALFLRLRACECSIEGQQGADIDGHDLLDDMMGVLTLTSSCNVARGVDTHIHTNTHTTTYTITHTYTTAGR